VLLSFTVNPLPKTLIVGLALLGIPSDRSIQNQAPSVPDGRELARVIAADEAIRGIAPPPPTEKDFNGFVPPAPEVNLGESGPFPPTARNFDLSPFFPGKLFMLDKPVRPKNLTENQQMIFNIREALNGFDFRMEIFKRLTNEEEINAIEQAIESGTEAEKREAKERLHFLDATRKNGYTRKEFGTRVL